jgi:hypothetical protein
LNNKNINFFPADFFSNGNAKGLSSPANTERLYKPQTAGVLVKRVQSGLERLEQHKFEPIIEENLEESVKVNNILRLAFSNP